MIRNVIIVVLAAACVFLGVSRYMERKAWNESEISPAEYGGLLELRTFFSSSDYREKVLPLLRGAFVDGRVTRERLNELGTKLSGVGARTLDALEADSTRDRVSRAWDDARDGAAAFGESLGRQVGKAMRELGDAVEGLKPKRAPESSRPEGTVDL